MSNEGEIMGDEIEIPPLPPRAPTQMDKASALLSEVKNALRAADLYPGAVAEAGVSWSTEKEAFEVVVRCFVKPDEGQAGKEKE